MVMKGLPLAYSKDMQEDKEPTFDAFDALSLCLAAMAGMVAGPGAQRARHEAAAGAGYSTATDLADWLVRELKPAVPRGPPHHRPHRRRGRRSGASAWRSSTLADMQAVEPRITAGVFEVLGVEQSVHSRTSYGGTAPANVRRRRSGGWRGWRGANGDAPERDAAASRSVRHSAMMRRFGVSAGLVRRGP